MHKELEAIQSALNKLDFLIDDDKRCECINDKAHKYIDIIQNQIDKLENNTEQSEKLKKAWEIVKEKEVDISRFNDICEKTSLIFIKDPTKYNSISAHRIMMDDYNVCCSENRKLTEAEFNLLKEMLRNEKI